MTLESILNREKNNFDLIRLCAAFMVIFGHTFALFPNGSSKLSTDWYVGLTSFGTVAVNVFFFLSGILVTKSFCNSSSIIRFIVMRVARLWPGLIVCLLVSVFLVGPITTELSLEDYFISSMTRLYFLQNVQLNTMAYELPGVFRANYFSNAVNGSLWTLPVELRCYLMVFFAGVAGLLYGRIRATVFVLAVAALIAVMPWAAQLFHVIGDGSRMPLMFLLGMLCYVNRKEIHIGWRMVVITFILAALTWTMPLWEMAFNAFVISAVLAISASKIFARFQPHGDYSYGIYIYGFIVQQALAHFFPKMTSYQSLFLSMPILFFLGKASWLYIESPSIGYAKKISLHFEKYEFIKSKKKSTSSCV